MFVRQTSLKRIEAALRAEIAALERCLESAVELKQGAFRERDRAQKESSELVWQLDAVRQQRDRAQEAAVFLFDEHRASMSRSGDCISVAYERWPWLMTEPEDDPTEE